MNPDSAKLLQRPELIKIVVSALTQTIASYTQTKVSAGAPYIKEHTSASDLAVIGLVRLDSAEFSLELVLGFSKNVFIALYENMFSTPVREISSENHDLAGEILNIAFGSMDPEFRKLNMRLNSSFPKIFSGAAVNEIMTKIGGQGIVIPYLTHDKKPFVIELYTGNSIQTDWQYDPGVKRRG